MLADLVIGKANENSAIIGQNMVYVRKMNQNQAWLAVGDPQIQKYKIDWTHKRIVDIKAARVRRVVITGPKQKIEIAKTKPSDKEFVLVNLPKGRKAKSAANRAQLAELGNEIDINDVRPLGKIDFSKSKKSVRLETFDGLVVQMKLVSVKKKLWIQYAVSLDQKSLKMGKLPKGSKLKSAKQVRQEAATMSARLKGWAYLPPVWARRTMNWTLEDLLVKEKKPAKKTDRKTAPAPDKKAEKKATIAPAKSPAPKPVTPPGKRQSNDDVKKAGDKK